MLQPRSVVGYGFTAHVLVPAATWAKARDWKDQHITCDDLGTSACDVRAAVGEGLPCEVSLDAFCVVLESASQSWWAGDVERVDCWHDAVVRLNSCSHV